MIKLIKSSFMFKFFILLVLLLIPSSVNASYYYPDDFIAILYDNINGSLTGKSAELENGSWNGRVGLTAYSSGAAWGFNLATPIIEGHTYTLSVNFSTSNQSSNDIIFSSVNRIGLGTTSANAKSSYENSTNTELIYTNNVNSQLQFAFKAKTSGSYLVVPFATPYSINIETVYFSGYVLEDLGTSSNISQDTINSSLNNQTNEINNSISNSENNIKDSISSSEDNIKDSLKETEDNIKNGIKDGFENCRDSYNLLLLHYAPGYTYTSNGISYLVNDDLSITINGTATANSFFNLNNSNGYYLNLKSGSKYTLYSFTQLKGMTLSLRPKGVANILLQVGDNVSQNTFTSSYVGDAFIYLRIVKDTVVNNVTIYPMFSENIILDKYEKYGEQVCKNRIDDTNDKLNDLNDNITNSDVDDSQASSFFDSFTTTDHGGISGIITAPLVAIKKMLDKNCSPLSATYKGKEISLPCGYDFWSKMPAIQEFINLTLGGILCYNIIRKLYKLIENMKNPDDDRVEVMKL